MVPGASNEMYIKQTRLTIQYCCVSSVTVGPGVSTEAVEASTPFEIGAYNAIIAFDVTHCIEVSDGDVSLL